MLHFLTVSFRRASLICKPCTLQEESVLPERSKNTVVSEIKDRADVASRALNLLLFYAEAILMLSHDCPLI